LANFAIHTFGKLGKFSAIMAIFWVWQVWVVFFFWRLNQNSREPSELPLDHGYLLYIKWTFLRNLYLIFFLL
jgi:hypothetical protein